jgi:hypothetical protein
MDVSDEVAKKTEERKSSAVTTMSSSLSNQQIMLIGAVLISLYFFVYVWKKIKPTEGIIIGAICAAIIYMLSAKGLKGMITLREAKALLLKELRYMQKETKEIPPGRIMIKPHSKLKNFDYKPNRYYIAFELIQSNDLRKIFVGEIDPFTGYVLGITEHPEGWNGSEVKADVQVIRLKEDEWRDKYGRTRQRY